MNHSIAKSLNNAVEAAQSFSSDEKNITQIHDIAQLIVKTFDAGNKILVCGNGGSACDAAHFAEEFTGRFRKNRKALPVIPLMESSHITCVANDFGFDSVFSRGVEAYGKPNDIFVGISTSGNSANVVKAFESAKKLNMFSIGMLGKSGGLCKNLCDHSFIIQAPSTDRIQEVHMLILHVIIESVERLMFPENY